MITIIYSIQANSSILVSDLITIVNFNLPNDIKPLLHSVTTFGKHLYFKIKKDHGKNFLLRRVHESVDDKSLPWNISQ